jgi:hypothetical protein
VKTEVREVREVTEKTDEEEGEDEDGADRKDKEHKDQGEGKDEGKPKEEIYSWAGFRVNELFFFVSCTCLQLDMSGTQPDSWKVTQMPGWTIAAGGVSCQWL